MAKKEKSHLIRCVMERNRSRLAPLMTLWCRKLSLAWCAVFLLRCTEVRAAVTR